MTTNQLKEIRLDDLAKEAVKQDKGFLSEMKVGDARAIVLNNDVVVVFEKIKELSKGRSKMEITTCLHSIRIDANLIDEEGLDNEEES